MVDGSSFPPSRDQRLGILEREQNVWNVSEQFVKRGGEIGRENNREERKSPHRLAVACPPARAATDAGG